jgi:glyoxylase-like metal-dependent hydrolase (beta-lactamase superfamily II)
MYQLERISDDIHRIVLEKPEGLPAPVAEPTNVYLLHGTDGRDPEQGEPDHSEQAPALINAGHPSQFEPLCHALRELGVEMSDLERVVYTSWNIEVLGAAANLPNVDHFVFSPDMVEPLNFESHVDKRRQEMRSLARRIVETEESYDTSDLGDVDAFVSSYYPPVPANLRFIPIRSGHTVAAGAFTFEVIATPGPDPGHIALYDADRRTLFGGAFAAVGLPEHVEEVQSYLISLERLQKLDVEMLLLNRGKVFKKRGDWTVKRSLRFFNSFMSTAPAAMHGAPTVVEFIERDLGYHIESLPELILQLERYKAPMDELVRARMIDAEGEGLKRRYGTDVEDERAQLRPD